MRNRDGSCGEARELAQLHLESLRAKLAELKALERTFTELVQSCDASRATAPGRSCEAWGEAQR